jgi:aarF domain-containing kinase
LSCHNMSCPLLCLSPDYKLSLKPGLEGDERAKVLAACHQRGADRLLQLCFKNGGIYTKLGQHVGQLDHLLPEEYVVTMRNNLLNRCPVTPYEDVGVSLEPEIVFRQLSEPASQVAHPCLSSAQLSPCTSRCHQCC